MYELCIIMQCNGKSKCLVEDTASFFAITQLLHYLTGSLIMNNVSKMAGKKLNLQVTNRLITSLQVYNVYQIKW